DIHQIAGAGINPPTINAGIRSVQYKFLIATIRKVPPRPSKKPRAITMFATSCMEEILSLTQDVSSLRSTATDSRRKRYRELVARAVRFSGISAEKPFIAVSGAALFL